MLDKLDVSKRTQSSNQSCRAGTSECDGGSLTHDVSHVQQTPSSQDSEETLGAKSKNQIISELEKEVGYWRSQALHLRNFQPAPSRDKKGGSISKRRHKPFADNNRGQVALSESVLYENKTEADDIISFYEIFPCLVIKNRAKEEISPFFATSSMYRDVFLSILISSIVTGSYKDALLHSMDSGSYPLKSKDAKLLKKVLSLNPRIIQTTNERQKQRIQQFLNNIVHPPETSENPAEKLLARIMEMNNKGAFIEDTCANLQYSEPLLELAHKLEELLPPLPSISIYMKHFYQEIYPLYPFAEISLIEESINNVLWPDPNNNFRVKLNLGQFEIRRKMMELVLLILCLKISETSIKVTLLHPCPGELSEHDYLLLKMIQQNPVSTEIFYLSFSCLAYLDVFQCTSETMVCYYLYLWVFFIITPERPDILVDQSSDTIAGIASALANDIGIYKDPSEHAQLKNSAVDPRLLNYRRKLWIGIALVCRYEVTFKGKFPQYSKDALSAFLNINKEGPGKYINLFERDMVKEDPLELFLQTDSFLRYQGMLKLQVLDDVFFDLHGRMKLSDLDEIIRTVDRISSVKYRINDLKSVADSEVKVMKMADIDVQIDVKKLDNLHVVLGHFSLCSTSLVVRHLLLVYFEQKAGDFGISSSKNYERYFTETLTGSIKLSCELADYFKGSFDEAIPKYSKIVVNKVAQVVLLKVVLALVGLILRLEHAEHVLGERLKMETALLRQPLATSQPDGCKQRIELIVGIRKRLENTLMSICDLGSQELRFQYLFTFKLFLLFDYVIHLIKKGELFKAFARILDPESQRESNLAEAFFSKAFLALGIDFSDSKKIQCSLNTTNLLTGLSAEVLKTIEEKMTELYTSQMDDQSHSGSARHTKDSEEEYAKPAPLSATKASTFTEFRDEPLCDFADYVDLCETNTEGSSLSLDDLSLFDYSFLFKDIL